MHLTQCEKGHFYDSDKYNQCPHCPYIIDFDFVWSLLDLDLNTKYKLFEQRKQIDFSKVEDIDIDDIRGGQIILGESKYFGSQNDCDIIYKHKYVSRKHFEIHPILYRLGPIVDFYITDLGSLNGTWINGEKLEPYKPYELSSNDLICVASIYKFKIIKETAKDNLEDKLKNSFIINEKSNLYLNIAEFIEDCGDNPFTQGNVHKKLVYQEPLRNLTRVEGLIVSAKKINDKFQVLIFNRNYILYNYNAKNVVGFNEVLKYEDFGVCDARIWYEIIITNGKYNSFDLHNKEYK